MTPMNESLLKADKLGRLRDTSEQKETMVEHAFRSSLNENFFYMQCAYNERFKCPVAHSLI